MNLINVRSDQQDVESLMQAVGQAVNSWEGGHGASNVSAPAGGNWAIPAGSEADLTQSLALMNTSWNYDSNAIIHSTRPRLGRYIIRFQLTVRRLTWWFTEPLIQQMRAFSANAARSTSGLYRQQNIQAGRIDQLSARVEALEAELKARQ